MYACYKDIIKYVVEQKALNKGWPVGLTLWCVSQSKYRMGHLDVNLVWLTYIAHINNHFYKKSVQPWWNQATMKHLSKGTDPRLPIRSPTLQRTITAQATSNNV